MGKVFVAKEFKKIKTFIDKNGNVVQQEVTEPGTNDFEARRRIAQALRNRRAV